MSFSIRTLSALPRASASEVFAIHRIHLPHRSSQITQVYPSASFNRIQETSFGRPSGFSMSSLSQTRSFSSLGKGSQETPQFPLPPEGRKFRTEEAVNKCLEKKLKLFDQTMRTPLLSFAQGVCNQIIREPTSKNLNDENLRSLIARTMTANAQRYGVNYLSYDAFRSANTRIKKIVFDCLTTTPYGRKYSNYPLR